jgi:hypothetical protein
LKKIKKELIKKNGKIKDENEYFMNDGDYDWLIMKEDKEKEMGMKKKEYLRDFV